MNDANKTYLGDGLYAEFDGYSIRLYCGRDNGTHEVFLEPELVQLLFAFANRVYVNPEWLRLPEVPL